MGGGWTVDRAPNRGRRLELWTAPQTVGGGWNGGRRLDYTRE